MRIKVWLRDIAIAAALLALTSCKTKYLPVETIRVDTTYISTEKWDSIYVLDSVFVRERGETLLIEKTKYKYIERVLRDTMYKERIDSVAVPYPVEKELTWWQGTCIKWFPWLLFVLLVIGLYVFRKPLKMLCKMII